MGSMLHDMLVVFFAVSAGFTASGIVANLYRLIAGSQDRFGRTVYFATMVVAGPNVVFEKATIALREKRCSRLAFGLAAAVAGYWSFALGLFVLSLVIAL
ncbi:MAG TPA: hypothetical protein VL286_03975 [Rhizomicrobium sp.]|nr:hypothetical protein [Rhizomicrobium sp.]